MTDTDTVQLVPRCMERLLDLVIGDWEKWRDMDPDLKADVFSLSQTLTYGKREQTRQELTEHIQALLSDSKTEQMKQLSVDAVIAAVTLPESEHGRH